MAIDDALNRNPRKNSFGDAAAAMSDPNVTQVQTASAPKAVQAPAQSAAAQMAALPGSQTSASISPTNIFPQGHPSAGRSPYASAPAAAAPAQAPAAPGNPASPSALYMQDRAREMKSQLGAGNYAGAAGTGVRTAIQGLGMYGIEAVDKTTAPWIDAGRRMVGGALGTDMPQGQGAVTASTASPGAQLASNPYANATPEQGRAMAEINANAQLPTSAPRPQSPAAMAMQTTGDVKREGNSYSGTNVAGDITINGQAPRNGGQIGAQNMAAGDALAGRQQQESMGRATAAQQLTALPPGIPQQNIEHSGNSWQARMDLRKAEVSASSIMNNGGRWDQHGRAGSPEGDAYRAMLGTDQALRQAQPGMDQAAMQQNAGLQREGMQQAGSTARAQMQEVGQNSRFGQTQGLARDKLGMEQQAQGFQTRAAAQQEQLRNQIMQEQDPVKRQSAVQRMRDLSGTQQADPYLVVPGGQQVDEMGKPYNMPSSVFNRQSGQFVQQPAQSGVQPSANHLAALRANPKQADFFDQVYGKGAAARILGGR